MQSGLPNDLMIQVPHLEKCPRLRYSIDSPWVSTAGSRLRIRTTSSIHKRIHLCFKGICLIIKKTGEKISRLPFNRFTVKNLRGIRVDGSMEHCIFASVLSSFIFIQCCEILGCLLSRSSLYRTVFPYDEHIFFLEYYWLRYVDFHIKQSGGTSPYTPLQWKVSITTKLRGNLSGLQARELISTIIPVHRWTSPFRTFSLFNPLQTDNFPCFFVNKRLNNKLLFD
jgi:hypothetical protein